MKTYIPTIEELNGKTRRYLEAIFRQAAEVADNAKAEPMQRAAAMQTMENVRRCLTKHPEP